LKKLAKEKGLEKAKLKKSQREYGTVQDRGLRL
jgi:hypothetical protein